ncbi:hypothetical protein [Paenibacillus sp. NAIST15-1]|uniref:hypothetical protein n=1 Tax=Paenibacillus sp. NAIST15-1 TaxID=1605994 RepID=UPI00086BBFC3|nr:hypothetical protein [Paenibacillus sp. NAIST15-1]GAV11286.1 hypothetical protein PBN151_1213 [Paenibacillus sp. NAIST15-1]
MTKQLTIAGINKQHKVFNEQEKITLSTGDFVLIQKKFKLTSIQNLIVEMTEILEDAHKKGVYADLLKDVTFIYFMLILRHFTNLNNISTDIEGLIKVCKKLIDLGLLSEIMQSFDKAELRKIDDAMKQVNENSRVIGEMIGSIYAKNELMKVNENKDAEK